MSEKDKLDVLLYNVFSNIYDGKSKNSEIELLANQYNVSVDYLHDRFLWLTNMEINPNFCHLDENHERIYKIFDEYNRMLNENNIEFYYTSGILAYLLVNKELERYHHDLDIFINMDCLEKLENICNNYNFSFERKIGERGDGTKRIMLKMYYSNQIDIPITVFMYIKKADGSIIQKDYFLDENDQKFVEYIYNSPLISQLSFSEIPKFHNNIEYYSITPEALFLCKMGNRPKDIYDCTIFRNIVNVDKLKILKEAFKFNLPNSTINAENDEFSNYIFEKKNKNKALIKYN